MSDSEIEALGAVSAALSAVEDSAARARVLKWANEKYGAAVDQNLPLNARTHPAAGPIAPGRTEIPGIARLSDDGVLQLTVRDVKATSANDAAVRLAHIAIRAHHLLAGQPSASSKKVVVPILKTWRVYDGNTRKALAQQKGIMRSGDNVELDVHSQTDADRFIEEALDDSVRGSWKPGNRAKKKAEGKSSKKN